jgi:hypothetical protein
MIKLIKVLDLKNIPYHIYISITASCIGIIASAIFYIYSANFLLDLELAKFSIFIVIFFSFLYLSLLGNDQEIISNSKDLNSKYIIINKRIFRIVPCYILSFLLLYLLKLHKNIFIFELSDSEFNILHMSILLGLFNRTIQSFCQASSKLIENSILDLSRNFGYLLFVLFWIFIEIRYVSLFFLISEFLVFLIIIFYLFFFVKNIRFKKKEKIYFNKNYLTLGISQFSYQTIFKLDIITLSIFGDIKLVILFSILSNVVEGIINFLNTFHPTVNNFIVKKINMISVKKDEKIILKIKNISSYLILLIIPFYVLFNFIVFKKIPSNDFLITSLILSISILLSKNLFIFFYFFSMSKKPINQLIFSLTLFSMILFLNIFLFKIFNILGIAISNFITFILYSFYLKKKLNFSKII